MAQRYTDPTALHRLSLGLCPECGHGTDEHGGSGGPGCTLTDSGLAERLYQYRADVTGEDS